ncbi:hypothetical protein [Schaalia sp. lx-100]|uniref:hypothetical protein n=1 Tax=Schaalia sp. lx-100 TaxID=2899081 RepID=UPI001E48D9F6|nr:hypothetical protein [Schaalia sp. lx-100]MCD4556647.1 hypothetical protein [Schaalia sp. lx-100]
MMKKQRRVTSWRRITAIITLLVFFASSWGIWEWGRREEHWGTSDSISHLSQQIMAIKDSDFHTRIVDRSAHRSIFGKNHPQWVEAQILPAPKSLNPYQIDALSQRLHTKVTSEGWAIDEKCAPDFLWCARRMDDTGKTLFMTVKPEQSSELTNSERMSGESEDPDDNSVVLRLRMQYL